MENNNELLRMISQALHQNQAINNELLRIISMTTLPPNTFENLKILLTQSNSTLSLIKEATPIE